MAEVQAMQGIIMATDQLAHMRLFQLISPSLPTGAFTYSQGIEWAVECGWVMDKASLVEWLESMLFSSFRELEIPLLHALYLACKNYDCKEFSYWSTYTVACRETKELRLEEINRGRAMAKLLQQLEPDLDAAWLRVVQQCQLAGFSLAAERWKIELEQAAAGYIWGWLENMVMAAVKIVPLGQTDGQQALSALSFVATETIEAGLQVHHDTIGGSCPAFTIGSCLHEKQYTRLFRS